MIEQYVLDELKKYKEENEELKRELLIKENIRVQSVKEEPVKIELIPIDNVVSKLQEKGIDIQKVIDEMGSDAIRDLIIELGLYKNKIIKENCTIVKVDNKYFEFERYYSYGYKLEEQVYIDLKEAVYYELVDDLYDKLNYYIKNQKKEEENNE